MALNRKLEYIQARVSGLWRTFDPDMGAVNCFVKTDSGRSLGLTGSVDPKKLRLSYGDRIVFAGYVSHYFQNSPVYTAKCIDRYRPSQEVISHLTRSSGPHVSLKTANALVNSTGLPGYFALLKLTCEPDIIDTIQNLQPAERDALLLESTRLKTGVSKIMLTFNGLTPQQAQDIFDVYGDQSVSVLTANFYQAAFDVEKPWARSFTSLDAIAQQNGVQLSQRIYAAVRHTICFALRDAGDISFCLADIPWIDYVVNVVNASCLGYNAVDRNAVINAVRTNRQHFSVLNIAGREFCYPIENAMAEQKLTRWVVERAKQPPLFPGTAMDIQRMIQEYEELTGYILDGGQIMAVTNSLLKPVCVITGGPGSGKTHVMGCIIYVWTKAWKDHDAAKAGKKMTKQPERNLDASQCVLTAPTGKAVKRMRQSMTDVVHKVMQAEMSRAAKDPLNPISRIKIDAQDILDRVGNPATVASLLLRDDEMSKYSGLIIVDEATMVGLTSASKLVGLLKNCQVIFMGDVDQLPSIDPGNVFYDLCSVDRFSQQAGNKNPVSVVRLTGNYRSKGAWILTENNKKLRTGTPIKDVDLTSPAFQVHDHGYNERAAVNDILAQYKQALSNHYAPEDIKVIAATRKGDAGVQMLNARLQDLCNPETAKPARPDLNGFIKTKGAPVEGLPKYSPAFRVGDRVIQTKNDQSLNVMNGDTGIITGYRRAKNASWRMTVEFDEGVTIHYREDSVDGLDLGYATTVHKAQGTEAPIVIFSAQPKLLQCSPLFATRNLIYTALTRASEQVSVTGSLEAAEFCVKNKLPLRRSLLGYRIATQTI